MDWKKHIAQDSTVIKDALQALDNLGQDTVLFIVNNQNGLVGALTDGDIRRGSVSYTHLTLPTICSV